MLYITTSICLRGPSVPQQGLPSISQVLTPMIITMNLLELVDGHALAGSCIVTFTRHPVLSLLW